ncbi:MAG: TIGR02147 family protein, partial [Bdellovibrionales bacterium]|nr:TIGR02147 family protein [Bdellovibrionales bacterium]
MELFRQRLVHEYRERKAKNGRYSLRSFAEHSGVYHGTLSQLLSGKRKISLKAAKSIGARLGVNPAELRDLLQKSFDQSIGGDQSTPYHLLHQDTFQAMADWHYDAILELATLPGVKLTANAISTALDIGVVEAREALLTLERLELLRKDASGRLTPTNQTTTNILDPDFSSAAMRKLQARLLEKSREALERIPRDRRDHTSLTVAMDPRDLPAAKRLAEKFRRDLNRLAQRRPGREVYQLQISLFPLSHLT